jgi:non-structural maintenance of chromosomes element 1
LQRPDQYLLQSFLSTVRLRIVDLCSGPDETDAYVAGAQVDERNITFPQFQEYIDAVNTNVRSFEYEIRSAYPQTASSREPEEAVYAFINLTSDPQTQLATSNTPDEIAFVKRVLDAMFDSNNTAYREVMAIREMDAINLARVRPAAGSTQASGGDPSSTQAAQTQTGQAASINKNEAERVLEELVESKWLAKSSSGFLSLNTRGVMELGRWLVATYNDPDVEANEWQRIKHCHGCKLLLTAGQRCPNEDCLCRLHPFCARSFFRDRQETDRKCPVCRTDWTDHKSVGEKAARREAPSVGRRSDGRQR